MGWADSLMAVPLMTCQPPMTRSKDLLPLPPRQLQLGNPSCDRGRVLLPEGQMAGRCLNRSRQQCSTGVPQKVHGVPCLFGAQQLKMAGKLFRVLRFGF